MKSTAMLDLLIIRLLKRRSAYMRLRVNNWSTKSSGLRFTLAGLCFNICRLPAGERYATVNNLPINPQHLVFAMLFRILAAFERTHPAISADLAFD